MGISVFELLVVGIAAWGGAALMFSGIMMIIIGIWGGSLDDDDWTP